MMLRLADHFNKVANDVGFTSFNVVKQHCTRHSVLLWGGLLLASTPAGQATAKPPALLQAQRVPGAAQGYLDGPVAEHQLRVTPLRCPPRRTEFLAAAHADLREKRVTVQVTRVHKHKRCAGMDKRQ